ncbi:MAG: hypothetical protein ACM3SW_06040 [Actinomycetota bacterium]
MKIHERSSGYGTGEAAVTFGRVLYRAASERLETEPEAWRKFADEDEKRSVRGSNLSVVLAGNALQRIAAGATGVLGR